ncbi:glycosyl hydrolase 115 family protein [Paenibacillus gallinarum]|uniref:Glycosyl hydrolase 115 family protein n=1 Tax=Paenibacillus gallinarum TaxID=2762232 RepID=A0ABR8T193_9BACL|nr:glycosyl hydrolase 115 family protein [Paenibacillus gallinarum]MBD7969462.1 glycosyl hydrolase 115 family protein [Paenibacillus gallinarum]
MKSNQGMINQFELLKRNQSVMVYVSDTENGAVHLAVKNVTRDIDRACGCKAVITKEIEQGSIVIGTLANNQSLLTYLLEKGVSLDKMKQEDGSYHWEAFLQEVVDGVFYIIGTDRRGTVFGIYDLCEAIGVSPWYYFADVPVKTKDAFHLPLDFSKADWPSVKYRGIFLNDEEELDEWAKLHTSDGTIGPATYQPIFELLLRLKANFIWPAMHVNYFNENPENAALADRMGIVVGTSHCDMLLRSNQNEWEPWLEAKGYTDAVYDYSIEGQNREILEEYWRESVENNKSYEVCYTVGMRGIHDSGFHTQAIDEDQSMNEDEKTEARVSLLGEVIQNQREIIRDVIGQEREQHSLQTFIPYKEVLNLYDRGLELPDNVTLIWANDNFGHVRRYPNEAERKRTGGNGLYYHNSYWATPGTAMSYLFINSIPLAHTGNELKKSYESGIRKLWILNVGGLKPLEQDMEFFLRYGWEAGKDKALTKNALQFTEHWINANFTGNHGAEAAELYEIFAQVTNVRKIEHMNSNVFSQTVLGDEAGRRLMKLEDIFRRGNNILYRLPQGERDAFFQLFLMKIHASYYTNHEFYYADRSVLSYDRGNMQAADHYVELSKKMMDYKRGMLHFYNKKMSSGKWEGILTPESFPPPPTAMYPARKPALKISGTGMSIHLWNEEDVLHFSIYGRRQKWFEIGNLGEGKLPFQIEITEGADFISISEKEGSIQTEKRILVSVNDPMKHAGKTGLITVQNLKEGTVRSVRVLIEEHVEVPQGFSGYIEADGYIAIPAASYHHHHGETDTELKCGWVTVPGIGRYEGAAVMAWNASLQPLDGEVKKHPFLGYDILLKESGEFALEIHRFLTLHSTGRIRFEIGIDDAEPIIVESKTRDEWMGNWKESVFNNGEKMVVKLPYLSAGMHVLKLYMVDHYVTISKMVLYTDEPNIASNLGPITSWYNHIPVSEHGFESPDVEWNEVERLCNELYKTKESEVPLPNVLYATRDFYKTIHNVFLKGVNIPQASLGKKRYANRVNLDSRKDIIKEFGAGKFLETNGVVAIEVEYVLENSENAYLTSSMDGTALSWSHLQAETNGRTGLAMHVPKPGILWEDPKIAPAMNYQIRIHTPGTYHIWLLLRHYNDQSDSCYLSLDGIVKPLSEQLSKGKLHTYNTAQLYYWCYISDLELTMGDHLFSILARKSELRIDRIYMSISEELPPADLMWKDSIRKV